MYQILNQLMYYRLQTVGISNFNNVKQVIKETIK